MLAILPTDPVVLPLPQDVSRIAALRALGPGAAVQSDQGILHVLEESGPRRPPSFRRLGTGVVLGQRAQSLLWNQASRTLTALAPGTDPAPPLTLSHTDVATACLDGTDQATDLLCFTPTWELEHYRRRGGASQTRKEWRRVRQNLLEGRIDFRCRLSTARRAEDGGWWLAGAGGLFHLGPEPARPTWTAFELTRPCTHDDPLHIHDLGADGVLLESRSRLDSLARTDPQNPLSLVPGPALDHASAALVPVDGGRFLLQAGSGSSPCPGFSLYQPHVGLVETVTEGFATAARDQIYVYDDDALEVWLRAVARPERLWTVRLQETRDEAGKLVGLEVLERSGLLLLAFEKALLAIGVRG